MEPTSTRDGRIAALASLDQPLRRHLYELLAARDRWTTRDEAAEALEVPRSVAAFHLDKLADAGVVDVTFERRTGRTGPGAGRPSKVYRLAADEVSASMPDRQYDLAGKLFADAIAESSATGSPIEQCLQAAASEAGRAIGLDAKSSAGSGHSSSATAVLAVLERRGYEPTQLDDGEVALLNCPFHRLAEDHRTMVCGMNLDFLSGVVDGLGSEGRLEACLVPEPGYCCVRLRER